ncbi:HlyD family type I secretion periplasmic adaptor subunit [Novosphingobium sp. AAP83]|uniref:HlyD family type I secretion periplasmic adaptor subunit n=1 Tax=Novosphingobium sp. AAP83 TaxID=1523425 RepID=UPI0006B945D3|nr:HlyD family type I secretion periplasmic adaptor subunit [Novosphingobium sp. AAP83]
MLDDKTTNPSARPLVLLPEMEADSRATFETNARLKGRIRTSFIAIGGLLGVLLIMSQFVQVTGAVMAQGALAVESQVKSITHANGGVLSQVLVRDGTKVRKGDILMRLDSSVSEVSANLSGASVEELRARRARLEAEVSDRASIQFPEDLLNSNMPAAKEAIERERRLLAIRRSERASQVNLLGERIRQAQSEIVSTQKQISAIRQQETLIGPELSGLRDLYGEKLVTINRLNEIERTAISLSGEAAALEARVAQIYARISEIRQQMLSVQQGARAEAGGELAQVIEASNVGEVRQADAKSAYERSVIRAPQDGIVYALAFSTPGSAIPAGQQILQIVPDGDDLVIDGRVSPADIDQLSVGQTGRVRFSAFSAQQTPEALARLSFVAPERTYDEASGMSFYKVKLVFERKKFEQESGLRLAVGMPAEVFITTGDRSLLSYLIKPFIDQFERAFRD